MNSKLPDIMGQSVLLTLCVSFLNVRKFEEEDLQSQQHGLPNDVGHLGRHVLR